jgi:uncharacterized membrane protein YtjA (UPF0391 family)
LPAAAATGKPAMRRVHTRFGTNDDSLAISPRGRSSSLEKHMLKWAIIFAIVSLITGWLGFGGVSGATATIAKVLFACFVILFLLAVLAVIGVFHIL